MRVSRRSILLGGALTIGGSLRSVAGSDTVVFNNTFCHRLGQSVAFRYSFDDQQLREIMAGSTASVIVHHGAAQPSDKYFVGYTHQEGLALFASMASGAVQVDINKASDLIKGNISDWRLVGGNSVPVTIAARQDGVFGEAVKHLLSKIGVQLPASTVAVSSYDELADFGSSNSGALLLGLRGASSRSDALVELPLNGKKLSDQIPQYPISTEVTVLFRRGDPQAIALGSEFANSLLQQAAADHNESAAMPAVAKLRALLQEHSTRP